MAQEITGHNISDDTKGQLIILSTLSGSMMENIREADMLSRWGGDEFIILSPETDIQEAAKTAEKLCQKLKKFLFTVVGSVYCSFGITQFKEGDDAESVVNRVDEALYKAKRSGRCRIEII